MSVYNMKIRQTFRLGIQRKQIPCESLSAELMYIYIIATAKEIFEMVFDEVPLFHVRSMLGKVPRKA